jgi:hypothetical protein
MRITTSNGAQYYDVKIKPDYNPMYHIALNWAQSASGNWNATDRGVTADYYEAEDVRLYGTESTINTFIADVVETNRFSSVTDPPQNVLILSNFSDTEKIFGADVDYSTSLNATVAIIDPRAQNTFKGWSVTCRIRLLPFFSFVGSATLPALKNLDFGYDSDAVRTINKIDSYDNTFYYQEHDTDVGLFSGVFTFTNNEMANLRRYHATLRGSSFSLTNIPGVSFPFGINRFDRHGSYPYTCKLMKIEDEILFGVRHWKCKLTLCEVV